jgi:hypothetical protein
VAYLRKIETLLSLYTDTGMMVEFDNIESETNKDIFLVFPHQAWEEMGDPKTITVTIEAGDTLND